MVRYPDDYIDDDGSAHIPVYCEVAGCRKMADQFNESFGFVCPVHFDMVEAEEE